jgi:heat shock protein HslJ
MRYIIFSLLFLASSFSASALSLEKFTWQLTQVGSEQIENSNIHMSFDADQNIVSGAGGCNDFEGYYRTNIEAVQIRQSTSTNNICDDMSAMQREDQFFVALHSAKTYSIYGNNLVLFNDVGQKIASFVGDANQSYSGNSLNKQDFSKNSKKDDNLLLTFLD